MRIFYVALLFFFYYSEVSAQPYIPAARRWTGGGDGHTWTNGQNWSKAVCTDQNGNLYETFKPPSNGEIVEFTNTGNISLTNCPFIILGNTPYLTCSSYNPSSIVSLYSMQINPFSYVTIDANIVAGGSVSQSAGTNISTALEIHEGRLTCNGIAGNYAQNGTSSPLNMNSIYAENSIIEINNVGGYFSPSGRSFFRNCSISCTGFGSSGNNAYANERDEFIGCTINTIRVQFGAICNAWITNCIFNMNNSTSCIFDFGQYSNQNNTVVLDNIQINAGAGISELVISYRQPNYTIKGNILCNSTNPLFLLRFLYGLQNSIPLKVDGNIKLNGGALLVQNGILDITGDLEMNGTPNPNYTKTVNINGQPIQSIGGVANYINYGNGSYGPIPGAFRYGLKFSGGGDSHVKWPIGFPVDTLLIEKTNCSKVYFDNTAVHVTGKLKVNSGQLVLTAHPPSSYSLIDGADMIIENGGSILVQSNADIAIAGNFIDNNVNNNSATCNGFSNPTNTTVAFYNNQFTPVNRVIGNASNTSVGNVTFINQNTTPFTLQNSFVTTNFNLGSNGKVILGNYDFTVNGTLTNYSNSKYFVTNGTGRLQLKNVGSSSVLFPIGVSVSSYTPVTILNNGTPDDFKARVQAGLLSSGNSGAAITQKAVNRTWFIEENTVGGSNANVTLQWNAADELSNFNRNNAYLIHHINNVWDFGSIILPSGNNPYQLTRNNITLFSPFAVSNQNSVLPLNLIAFTAYIAGMDAVINWKTDNEVNTLEFIIERSTDGRNYSAVGITSSNNTQGINIYNFTDSRITLLGTGVIYYRLKQKDVDGRFTYSRIVAISADKSKSVAMLYPNPAHNELNLILNISKAETFNCQIIDATGKIIKQEIRSFPSGGSSLLFDIMSLSSGMYYLYLKGNATSKQIQFIKK